MNKIFRIILIASAYISGSSISASDMSYGRFMSIVDSIALNNKAVAAAAAQDISIRSALRTENRLEAPGLSFSHRWGQRGVGNKWSVEVSQAFDWPGLYASRRRANRLQAIASQSAVAKVVYDSRCGVAQSLATLIYSNKLQQLYSANLTRIDSLLTLYQRGFDEGEISILDVNKLKIERITASRNVAVAAQAVADAESMLLQLNGGKPVDDYLSSLNEFPQATLLPVSSYILAATTTSPEIIYRRNQVEATRAGEEVARRSRLPGFTVGVAHDYELGESFNGISLSFSLPFLTKGKNVEAARVATIAAETEAESAELSVRTSIESLYKKALMYYDEQLQYGKILAANDSERLLNLALRQGQITLIDYMVEINYFTEAKAAYIEVCYNYLLSVMALNLQIRPTDF